MATARLRKTFHYPEDDNSDEPAEGIDEEEQEKLISDLQAQDTAKTALYTKIFLSLPLLFALTSLPSLFRPASFSAFLNAILRLSSFLAGAYILYYMPLPPAGSSDGSGVNDLRFKHQEDGGPVEKYLVYLNAGLCSILTLGAWVSGSMHGPWMRWQGIMPAAVFITILIIRIQLRPLNVSELERLRYRYKGA